MDRESTFRQLLVLGWPVMVEEALTTLVQYVDTAMVGRIGAAASAAVGLTGPVTWLVNAPLWAMGTGVLAVISREIGAGNPRRARQTAVQALWIAAGAGLLLFLLTEAIGPVLPGIMGAEASLCPLASAYFMIVCAPMVFRALFIVLASALRAVGDTKTPMRISLLVNLLNITLNALLIFPSGQVEVPGTALRLPGFGLGVRGAALATACGYVAGGLLMVRAIWRHPVISPGQERLAPQKNLLGACLRIGMPSAVTRVISCLGHVVFASQVTRLGTRALAAHSLAITAEEGFYIPGYGLQAAVAATCGHAAGAGREDRVRHTARTGIVMTVIFMSLTGLVLFLIPEWMMRLFTRDPQVILAGAQVLRIVAVSEPFFGAAVILEGVFNGIGDTRAPMFFSLLSMWGVRIALTQGVIMLTSLGLPAVWGCMVLGNLSYLLMLSAHYLRGHWRYRTEGPMEM